jgi:hypothetical protein
MFACPNCQPGFNPHFSPIRVTALEQAVPYYRLIRITACSKQWHTRLTEPAALRRPRIDAFVAGLLLCAVCLSDVP